jgi:hypothetical protein
MFCWRTVGSRESRLQIDRTADSNSNQSDEQQRK